ncbi:hypothetical protein Csa_016178, partial [Cucumis sativus]
ISTSFSSNAEYGPRHCTKMRPKLKNVEHNSLLYTTQTPAASDLSETVIPEDSDPFFGHQ